MTPRTEIFSPVYMESFEEEGRSGGLASGVQSLLYVFSLIIDRVAPVSTSMVVSTLLSTSMVVSTLLSYRDFDRHGPRRRGVVESVLRVHGLVRMCRLELVIPGFSSNASCRLLVTGLLAADGCKMTDLPAVVASGGLELADGG